MIRTLGLSLTDIPAFAQRRRACSKVVRYGSKTVLGHADWYEYGPNTDMGVVMRAQVGDCPKRDAAQIHDRCDPYCPTLVELFFRPSAG